MTARRPVSRQGKPFAAGVALALLVAWSAGPATASPNTPVVGVDVAESASEFGTFSPRHFLAPRVEAELRRVFKDPGARSGDIDESVSSKRPAMTTRVPGISDEQLARYKRQMCRKDI